MKLSSQRGEMGFLFLKPTIADVPGYMLAAVTVEQNKKVT